PEVGTESSRRDRPRLAGQPARSVATPESPQGGGSRGGPAGRHAPRLLHRSPRAGRAARVARSVLGSGAGGGSARSRSKESKGSQMTSASITIAPVRKSIRVKAGQAHAFEVFTAGLGRWWPLNHGIGPTPRKAVVMETHLGGRWYEVAEDGSQTP